MNFLIFNSWNYFDIWVNFIDKIPYFSFSLITYIKEIICRIDLFIKSNIKIISRIYIIIIINIIIIIYNYNYII